MSSLALIQSRYAMHTEEHAASIQSLLDRYGTTRQTGQDAGVSTDAIVFSEQGKLLASGGTVSLGELQALAYFPLLAMNTEEGDTVSVSIEFDAADVEQSLTATITIARASGAHDIYHVPLKESSFREFPEEAEFVPETGASGMAPENTYDDPLDVVLALPTQAAATNNSLETLVKQYAQAETADAREAVIGALRALIEPLADAALHSFSVDDAAEAAQLAERTTVVALETDQSEQDAENESGMQDASLSATALARYLNRYTGVSAPAGTFSRHY